jgi:DNA-binding SARP family transcriptional activator
MPTQSGTQSREKAHFEHEVFELFPFSMLVVDSDGHVIAANRMARGLLEELGEAQPPRCCDILGCRSPDGPLGEDCFTERALRTGRAIAEVRIDMPNRAPLSAAWVAAAPIAGPEPRVVFQLRPGEAHDRRRRTRAQWALEPVISIRTFGRMEIEGPEGPLGGSWLSGRAGQILKYLLAERHRVVLGDEIAEAIWPSSPPSVGNSVRHFIHVLRDKLEPDRQKRVPSPYVLSRKGGYALDLTRIHVDADMFEDDMRAGLLAYRRDQVDVAISRLSRALSIYHDDFLADLRYTDWAMPERNRLRGLAAEALATLARISLAAGDTEGAFRHFERLAALQPFDSHVQRQLIALALARGQRTEALRLYETLRQRMLREFGEEPEFSVRDICVETELSAQALAAP